MLSNSVQTLDNQCDKMTESKKKNGSVKAKIKYLIQVQHQNTNPNFYVDIFCDDFYYVQSMSIYYIKKNQWNVQT